MGFRRTVSDTPYELTHEVGIANLIVWPGVFERYRRLFLTAGSMGVQGQVQRQGIVVP